MNVFHMFSKLPILHSWNVNKSETYDNKERKNQEQVKQAVVKIRLWKVTKKKQIGGKGKATWD